MATILDVAKVAGVSKSTVSRFLNGQGSINSEAVELIKNAIRELNFTPNHFAQGMRTSKTSTIGVIIPDYANPFYPELLRGIEDYARTHGYMTQLSNTDANPELEYQHLENMVNRQMDGIVLCSYNRNKKDMDFLVEIAKKIPVVIMDPLVKKEPLSYVITDGLHATIDAVNYLISIGRKRIGYIKGPNRLLSTNERFEGYKRALEMNAIPFDKSLVYEADFSLKSGYSAAEWFIAKGLPIDALMAATDLMAIGALEACNNRGVLIPNQLAIVGFDNISLCKLVEPTLTTIAQPISQLGANAAQIIIDADINPMMSMMVSKPLQNFVNILAQRLKDLMEKQ